MKKIWGFQKTKLDSIGERERGWKEKSDSKEDDEKTERDVCMCCS